MLCKNCTGKRAVILKEWEEKYVKRKSGSGIKGKTLAFVLAFALAAQSGMQLQMQAAEKDSSSADAEETGLAGVQIVDGEFCCYSEDGTLDEKQTNALREAAQKEADISPLTELIGEPLETEYFGQGCWFGTSGEERGEDGAWYYKNFVIYVYKTDDITYYMGVVASPETETDFPDLLERKVQENTDEADSPAAKLKELFEYVEEEYSYARKVGFEAYDGWQEDYALEMLTDKAGSCYHYAALYAFLAKAAVDYEVRICIGTTDGFDASSWQPHAWTEIEIDGEWFVFDTNMDKYAADSSLQYYRIETDSDDYEKLYRPEETCTVTLGTEPSPKEDAEAGQMPEDESSSEKEAGSAAEAESGSEEEAGSAAETESGSEEEAGSASGAETETESEAESGTETESETEAPMTEKVEVTEDGDCVWTMDNFSELAFTEARLEGDVMTLVDTEGTEHRFTDADREDIGSPYLIMYGSFLSMKYMSAESGKAARLVEEGDELTFREPQSMKVLVTVYVRSGAGLDFGTVAVANRGSEIKVTGETGKWYRVSLSDGREGYISKVGVIADEGAPNGSTQGGQEPETETETEPVPETVVVESEGEYYRYLRFTPAEDTIVEIDGEPCYVTAGGKVSEGWKVLDGRLYYSDADGSLKCSETYEGITFGKDGAAESNTDAKLKIRVIQIIDSVTDDTMTKSEKLSACWGYVTKGNISYAGKYPDLNADGWQRAMALDTLTSGSGNCYGFACAFAALAEGVGYSPEVICGRVSGSRDQAADGLTRHSWVMIDGCHYDPEAQWAGWCPGIYGNGSYPVTHTVQKTVTF